MLADIFDEMRGHLVDELERRLAVTQGPRHWNGARRARLDALVGQVVEVLRQGSVGDGDGRMASVCQPELELDEHALVEGYLLEKARRLRLETSDDEVALVRAWRSHADCQCLTEQHRRLTTLLDGVGESAALVTPEGRLLYCNRRAAQVLHEIAGLSKEEIIGKTPAELGVPMEVLVGRPVSDLTALARARESYEVNIWGRTKEAQFEAIYGPDGAIAAIALHMRDIHGRKQAQTRLGLLSKLSALAGILEFNEVAQRLAAVPIPELADWCVLNIVKDRQIRRTFLGSGDPSNQALQDALKRIAPGWRHHPLWQELLEGGFQLLTEVSDDLLRKLTVNEEQYRLLAKLGLRSLLVIPLLSRGQTSGIITLAYTSQSGRRYGRDDPALAEEFALHAAHALQNARLLRDLRSSEARFRVALAGARTVVFEQDEALRYTWYHNPLAPSGPAGRTPEEALPSDEAALLTTTKRRVLEGGEGVYDEIDLTMANERRHYREAIEPIRSRSGRVVGIIGAVTDITEQQLMKQQLTADLTFREQMMAVLGHDLRNPLSAISIAGEILRRADLPAGSREQAHRIGRAAGRMKEMIDTLLDFTRVRSLGAFPLSLAPADLGEIARAVLDEVRATHPDHPVLLQARGELRGEWDPPRVAQLISNLVGNAIAYGTPGAPVDVVVEGDVADVTLSVHNQGTPIPPDLIRVIFEPFRRGVPGDHSPGGLGLGLYIANQIVLAHQGTLGVESTAERGTTFTARLPRKHAPPTVTPPRTS